MLKEPVKLVWKDIALFPGDKAIHVQHSRARPDSQLQQKDVESHSVDVLLNKGSFLYYFFLITFRNANLLQQRKSVHRWAYSYHFKYSSTVVTIPRFSAGLLSRDFDVSAPPVMCTGSRTWTGAVGSKRLCPCSPWVCLMALSSGLARYTVSIKTLLPICQRSL